MYDLLSIIPAKFSFTQCFLFALTVLYLALLFTSLQYVLAVIDFFSSGEEVDLSGIMDPNTVAGLLKLHFRELRFSIIPRGEPTKSLLEAMKVNNVSEL